MKKILPFLLFVSFFGAKAQNFSSEKMDSLITALESNNKSMGSLCISKNGKTVYAKAWGYSAIGVSEKWKSNTETKFRIGSISKMFTAVMIFQAIDEKKLKRSDLLSKYFPEIPNAKKITIDNLLNHRSGLYNFTDTAYVRWLNQARTQKQMLAMMAKQKTEFEPDKKAEYSNTNYVLLGYILEKITKKSYADNLNERIAKRIPLSNTKVGAKINISANEASSFKFSGGNWEPDTETDMSIPGGAGAVISTPTDLTKFITALFNKKLMSDSSLNTMTTLKDGYGRGIFIFPFGERAAVGHNGGIDGFQSMLAWFANDSVAVGLTCNGNNISMNESIIGILSIYFGKPYVIPSYKMVILPEGALEKYEGTYATKAVPLKITVKKKDKVLFVQATGQSGFELETINETEFKFAPAGVKMIFKIENEKVNTFTLKQGGGEFLFERE